MLWCQKVPRIFGQVRFVEKGAIAWRLQIDAADFHVQRVFLRRDNEVSAVTAELAIYFCRRCR